MIKYCIDCGTAKKSSWGDYCKPCNYKHRTRPSGLQYKLIKYNPTSFRKGNIPWQIGTVGCIISPNKGKKGVHFSPKTEFKKGDKRLMGENNPNWNGGITPSYNKLRNSPEAREWRKAVFKRDNYTCQICSQRGGVLNADHIKQFAYYPELRFELSNGRTLCESCHKKTDTYRKREKIHA